MLKPIKGFERYLISSEDGSIYSNAKGKTMYKLKAFEKPDGYLAVSLWDDNSRGKKVRKTLLVHRLVGLTFLPNPENKPTINHKDGNKKNNCVYNLEWATLSEQQVHAFSNDLNYARKCEKANRAELTWDDVHFIRNNAGKLSPKQMRDIINKVGIEEIYAILYNLNFIEDNYVPYKYGKGGYYK